MRHLSPAPEGATLLPTASWAPSLTWRRSPPGWRKTIVMTVTSLGRSRLSLRWRGVWEWMWFDSPIMHCTTAGSRSSFPVIVLLSSVTGPVNVTEMLFRCQLFVRILEMFLFYIIYVLNKFLIHHQLCLLSLNPTCVVAGMTVLTIYIYIMATF